MDRNEFCGDVSSSECSIIVMFQLDWVIILEWGTEQDLETALIVGAVYN